MSYCFQYWNFNHHYTLNKRFSLQIFRFSHKKPICNTCACQGTFTIKRSNIPKARLTMRNLKRICVIPRSVKSSCSQICVFHAYLFYFFTEATLKIISISLISGSRELFTSLSLQLLLTSFCVNYF